MELIRVNYFWKFGTSNKLYFVLKFVYIPKIRIL